MSKFRISILLIQIIYILCVSGADTDAASAGIGFSAIRSVGLVKGSDAWDLNAYSNPAIRFMAGRSLAIVHTTEIRRVFDAVSVELSKSVITGTHRSRTNVSLHAPVYTLTFFFDSGYLKTSLPRSILLNLSPGFSLCAIPADYKGYLYYGCGLAEEAGEQVFFALPIFVDIGLRKRVSSHFRFSIFSRIGLRTFGGTLAAPMCGMREDDFPCSNTGVNLGAMFELVW